MGVGMPPQVLEHNNYEYFMEADVGKFTDEWIAIMDSKIVAHDRELSAVIKEVEKRYPNKRVLFYKVPGKETMIY